MVDRDIEAAIAERLHVARKLAFRAGEILLAHLGRTQRMQVFEAKDSAVDLVTAADRESEALVAEQLASSFPGEPLVREEADGRAGASRRRSEIETADFAWCIDPLDGTTNFVHGLPPFAVSIGLLHRGQPALGVVHAPALGETFTGGRGVPAALNGRPIRVSDCKMLDNALISTGFPYDRRARIDTLLGVLKRVVMSCQGVRRQGSASLDLCNVACGRVDGYYEIGLGPWDTAAAHAILESAGGEITGFGGAAHDLFGANTIGSNGAIHAPLVAVIGRDLC